MTEHTLLAALDLCEELGEEYISFGGGEPTIHPEFFPFLRTAMIRYDFSVWLASNGSMKDVMLRLARIMHDEDYESFEYEMDDDGNEIWSYDKEQQIISPTRENQLSVDLSTDYWHDYDMVDHVVRDMWEREAGRHGYSSFSLRDVSRNGAIRAGRAEETGVYSVEGKCVCADLIIEPDGAIRACGCSDAPQFGTVFNPEIPDYWQSDCHKEQNDD